MVQYKVDLVGGESHLLHYCPGSECPVLYNIGQVSYIAIPSIVPHDKMDKKYTIFGKKRVSLRFRRIRRNLREAAKTGPL